MGPSEYLRAVERSPLLLVALLDRHAGDLASAAHELATIRLAARSMGTPIPSAAELGAAAEEIAARAGYTGPVPPADVLARDARAQGLAVT